MLRKTFIFLKTEYFFFWILFVEQYSSFQAKIFFEKFNLTGKLFYAHLSIKTSPDTEETQKKLISLIIGPIQYK